MLVGTELQALKAIADRGGKSTIWEVAAALGCSSDYAGIMCRSLGTADYIDLRRSGVCEITAKGRQELDKSKARAKG
jgi:Mn-dependent DtxR family transcriptional regulator